MEKPELIRQLTQGREDFQDFLNKLPEGLFEISGATGFWSVKDVLNHLLMWEAETIKLMYHAANGQRRPQTAHFSGQSDDEQNAIWNEQTKDRPLEKTRADFNSIRGQTLRRIEDFSEQELLDPKKFAWLKGHSLAELLTDYITDHEAYHLKLLKEWRESN